MLVSKCCKDGMIYNFSSEEGVGFYTCENCSRGCYPLALRSEEVIEKDDSNGTISTGT